MSTATWRRVVPAPGTLLYAALLAAVAGGHRRLPATTQHRVLRRASTNVANLRRGRVDTVVTSALLLDRPGSAHFLATVPLVGGAEHALGTRRAAVAFAVGHVGATAVVAGLLAAHALAGVPDDAVDVGPSYGALAAISAAAVARPVAPATALAAAAAAVSAVPLVLSPTFTDVGHAASCVIGAAVGALWRWRDGRLR